MMGFVSDHICRYALSNLELRRSHNALRNELGLRSALTVSNICRREYALTRGGSEKHVPSRNEVRLALKGWTSTATLAIMLVIAYCMDRSWALREVQCAINEVDRPFFPHS